jgi:hypothetical protein
VVSWLDGGRQYFIQWFPVLGLEVQVYILEEICGLLKLQIGLMVAVGRVCNPRSNCCADVKTPLSCRAHATAIRLSASVKWFVDTCEHDGRCSVLFVRCKFPI